VFCHASVIGEGDKSQETACWSSFGGCWGLTTDKWIEGFIVEEFQKDIMEW